ncbi:probable disease resistance protein At4g27220 [Coffea eugenioides]|uniref:probable disease resistance protein At4g27220 n=1 Tax=Coffea eugenioides TaxID=49369 RepID=UPI000F6149A7|nr:probable disease resistance protein At4g27220 [Coffea eugenioides]
MPSCLPNIIGAVIPSVVQAIKDASTYLKDKYDKVKKIKENFDELENEERLVHATKSTLEEAITRRSIDMEPTEIANAWLELVKKREKEVQELKNKYLHIHKCLCGMWPFYKLMKLSKDLMEKTDELKELKADIDLQNALREKKFDPGEIKLAGDEDHIPISISETVEELLKWLDDKEVKRIGIWGMAGVGKTRILMRLNDKAYQLGKLNPIIWVKVQNDDTVKNIQSDILAWLKLEVQHRDRTAHVAHKISMALEKLDYLLLLDQCPGDIDLNEVGIRHNHKGKVIVASRDKSDCAAMDIHRVFKVSKLSDGDAEELFKETVGDIADHPHFKGTKEQILRQLGGLPLAIKAIAIRLKDQPESVWYDKLRELQSPKNFGDQFEELFKAFEFSYKNLPGDDFRKCLLYGALFPPDYEIDKDYLTECWISEEFISAIELAGAETNVQELSVSRDRGHRILQALTEACLFEWCSRSNFLTTPTPFRKIAMTFTYPQEGGSSLLVRGQEKLTSPPEKEQWTGAKRISLMCNKLRSLPECPECPTTTTLLLQRNKQLVTIHEIFFASMVQLKVLDLHHTKIRSLPPSIIKLVELKSLYLNECWDLVSLSEHIGKLTNLEILDIRDTGLQSLPTEVAQLVSLRCLRVSFVYNPLIARYNGDHNKEDNQPRQIIPHNVIGLLYHLEELTIIVDPREQSWNDVVTSVVEEITNLESLTTLFIYFPKVEFLTTFIDESRSWKNTRRYREENSFRAFRIIVGSNGENHNKGLHSSRGPAERHLRFSAGENVCCEAIRKVLRRSSAFELIGNQDTKSLSDIGIDCMESLAVCVVEGCDQISSIISCGSDAARIVFPFLEKLDLVNLKSLCCILDGSVGPQSFSNLTSIIVLECRKLKKLISLGMVKNLENLKHLKIQDCLGIEEVIESEEILPPNGELLNLTGFLPKLEILELVNLPLLESICKNDSLDWRSLQKIEIIDCSKLNNWSRGMYNAKHLRKIECQERWWVQLQLPDEVKGQLKKRCCVIREEVPSVYYTPREEGSHQPPDLRNLSDRFEQPQMLHEDSISQGSSSRRHSP